MHHPLVRFLKSASLATLVLAAGVLVVYAADGSGTNSVNPTTASVASTGNTLTFTFTATEAMDGGEVAMTVPSTWSSPQGTSGVAGYTTFATAGMIGSVLDNAESTTGWSAGDACTNGLTADGATKFEGSFSIRCANGDEAGTDAFFKTISASNWSSYTTVSFWVRTSVDVPTNRLYFGHAETATYAGANDFTVGALTANTWTRITHTLQGAIGARDAVQSFGFVYRNSATAFDGVDIYIDDFLIGPGVSTFPGGGDVRARLLQLSSGQTVTVAYGAGGGTSGATAPSTDETSVFTTKTRTSGAGTLTSIASSPMVTVGTGGSGPPEPEPAPAPSGGSGNAGEPPPLNTSVRFSGRAYPGSTIEVLKKALKDDRYSLNPAETVSMTDGGDFDVQESGMIAGEYVYALSITDIDGRNMHLFFDVNLLLQSHYSTQDILVPPTATIENQLLSRAEDLRLIGYAAANTAIEAEIDGILSKGEAPYSDKRGFYTITIPSGWLSVGTHYVRVRQVDLNGKKSDFSAAQAFKKYLLVAPRADFDGSGKVDISDWSIFLFRWNSEEPGLRTTVDLDDNGTIDIFDLSIFLRAIQL